ncbi:MAG: DUF2892 domain-containing protein [Mariprofundaceae bacterium]
MKANVGCTDRIVRTVLGVMVLAAGLLAGLATPWNFVADGVGVILILTAGISFCPAYAIFGASTCKTCKED